MVTLFWYVVWTERVWLSAPWGLIIKWERRAAWVHLWVSVSCNMARKPDKVITYIASVALLHFREAAKIVRSRCSAQAITEWIVQPCSARCSFGYKEVCFSTAAEISGKPLKWTSGCLRVHPKCEQHSQLRATPGKLSHAEADLPGGSADAQPWWRPETTPRQQKVDRKEFLSA